MNGNDDFVSAIWVQGLNSEMQILPSKLERNSAKAAAAQNARCPPGMRAGNE